MAWERALLASKTGDQNALQQLHLSGALHDGVADDFGATCVHHAARTGQLDSLKYLVQTARLNSAKKAKNGATPAHDAAATGQLACLQWLLKFSGCNVRDRDTSGATVLHLAARFGHLPVLQWLVSEGCDLQDTAGHGVTALHFAAANGDVESLKYLLTHAPSLVNATADNGTTPVYFAIQEGHLDCAEHLAAGGANVHHKANDGMRPVHAAAQMGHLNILIWLVNDQDALPTERDNDGATPIHFASSRGHAKVVSWLLLHGGKCEKDNLGGTPMHDAAEHGQLECLKVLVDAGEDVHGQDHDGFTPADLAEECGHTGCAKYLRTVMKEKPRRPSAPSIAKQPQRSHSSMRENTKPVHGEPVRAAAELGGVREEEDRPDQGAVYQNGDDGDYEYEYVLTPARDETAPSQLVKAEVHSKKKDSAEETEPYPAIPPPDYDMDDEQGPVSSRESQPVFVPPPPPDEPPPALPLTSEEVRQTPPVPPLNLPESPVIENVHPLLKLKFGEDLSVQPPKPEVSEAVSSSSESPREASNGEAEVVGNVRDSTPAKLVRASSGNPIVQPLISSVNRRPEVPLIPTSPVKMNAATQEVPVSSGSTSPSVIESQDNSARQPRRKMGSTSAPKEAPIIAPKQAPVISPKQPPITPPKPKLNNAHPPSPIIIVPENVPTSPTSPVTPAFPTVQMPPPVSPKPQEKPTGEVLVIAPTNNVPPPPHPLSPTTPTPAIATTSNPVVDVTTLPSMQTNGVPQWKQAILAKKQQAERGKDAADRKKLAEEAAMLAQVPHWKREIVKRKMEQQRKEEEEAKEKQEAEKRLLEEEEKQFKEKLKQEGVDDNKLSPWQLEMIKKKKQLIIAT